MKLQGIAQQAKHYPAMVFNNVLHLIDREFLREAYHQTHKSSAPGMDQVTAQQYAEHLEDNLRDLHERLRDQRYVAPPVERVWIEKDDGKKRPIGKPCFEDKIVQRAVVMILEAIFEQDFHAFSHGFRKGHSPHQALHELREQCRTVHITWIVDADVSGFFDNLDWSHLREFLQRRVNHLGQQRASCASRSRHSRDEISPRFQRSTTSLASPLVENVRNSRWPTSSWATVPSKSQRTAIFLIVSPRGRKRARPTSWARTCRPSRTSRPS